ncbi:MAG: VWA domain-containing protein [Deltaproteobacteria bacterium]|nr:VWA domain-containing protein [Deltaproteobacteria bacterium]MBW2415701.1 VWA domain-containing protein [Deltaproteobacteria bacterium]
MHSIEPDPRGQSPSHERPDPRRARWIAMLALFCATVALGALTRSGVGTAGPRTAIASPGLHFFAPGTSPVSFEGHLDRAAVLQGTEGIVHMQLVMRGEERPDAVPERLPTDLVVVLDRSGSMRGDKLRDARAAIRELLARLGPEDRFALVTYSNQAAVRIPLSPATPQSRDSWFGAVASIRASGATNLSAGLDSGLSIVEASLADRRVPRVILISDGLANRGDSTRRGLVAIAGRAARGEFTLSSIGVGQDFNEAVMTAIADAGTGNYYYLENSALLANVFAAEFDAARSTVASALELRIEPASGVRVVEAAGYPLGVEPGVAVIRPGALFAGQERRIWVTLALSRSRVGQYELGHFALAYTDGDRRRMTSFSSTPVVGLVAERADFLAGVDVPVWEKSVSEEGYGRLQQSVSEYVRGGDLKRANEEIDRYVRSYSELNDSLRSKKVAEGLARARALKGEVGEAFDGPRAPAKRNAFSKDKSYQARKLRRSGAAPDPTTDPNTEGGSR